MNHYLFLQNINYSHLFCTKTFIIFIFFWTRGEGRIAIKLNKNCQWKKIYPEPCVLKRVPRLCAFFKLRRVSRFGAFPKNIRLFLVSCHRPPRLHFYFAFFSRTILLWAFSDWRPTSKYQLFCIIVHIISCSFRKTWPYLWALLEGGGVAEPPPPSLANICWRMFFSRLGLSWHLYEC